MQTRRVESWGRLHNYDHKLVRPYWRSGLWDLIQNTKESLLGYGCGKSYGDSCLNDGGTLIETGWLNRFLDFDQEGGRIRVEAGMKVSELLDWLIPRGYFLPVVPGTQHLTLGGAVANDIHGKNHHKAGTLGCFVTALELVRSVEGPTLCSAEENAELFKATIGGMGLTGLISWVELKLLPIASSEMDVESIRFERLSEFFDLNEKSKDWDYTVAWVDTLAKGASLGRGHFLRARHSPTGSTKPTKNRSLTVPFQFPSLTLNKFSIKLFNELYYQRQMSPVRSFKQSYSSYFFPLDRIEHWNRIYGKKGFYQYQFVLPWSHVERLSDIMIQIAEKGAGSFLAVLKVFGEKESPGLLSFPMPGVTLALDFPNRGNETLQLFRSLDVIVEECQGRVYPAKDARMNPQSFRKFFPNFERFESQIDPKFSSSFWRRVMPDSSLIQSHELQQLNAAFSPV